MPLAYEHVGSKKPAKINTYMHTRAELLITLCYEIPCKIQEAFHKNASEWKLMKIENTPSYFSYPLVTFLLYNGSRFKYESSFP